MKRSQIKKRKSQTKKRVSIKKAKSQTKKRVSNKKAKSQTKKRVKKAKSQPKKRRSIKKAKSQAKKRGSIKKNYKKEECKRNKISTVMREFKYKKLKTRYGKTVINPKQAIAIALSEATRAC
jgi:hypothetical protein